MHEGDGEKVTVEKEGGKGTGDERSRCDIWNDERMKGSKSRCHQTEEKKRTTEKAAGGKVSNQGDAKRRSYSEELIGVFFNDGLWITSKLFEPYSGQPTRLMHNSWLLWYVMCYLMLR